MNYSIRDKSGKQLGSFDLPTLSTMLKARRLSGDEEVLGSDQRWKPLNSISELAAMLGPAATTAGIPPPMPTEDLKGLFDDFGGGDTASDVPDFTLPGTTAGVQQPVTKAPPKPGAAAPATAQTSGLDELWSDDQGNPVAAEENKTIVGAPPTGKPAANDSTVMGAPRFTPPPPPPAAAAAQTFDAKNLFDDKPKPSPAAANKNANDPLSDLLSEEPLELETPPPPPPKKAPPKKDDMLSFPESAPPMAAKGGAPKEDLEDLFSAPPAESKSAPEKSGDAVDDLLSFPAAPPPAPLPIPKAAPKAKGAMDPLDAILNSTPDAMASDLTMPDAPPAAAAKPAPKKPSVGPEKSPEKTAKSKTQEKAPKLPIEKKKEVSQSAFAERLEQFKENFAENKAKYFIGLGVFLVVAIGAGVGLFFLKAKNPPTPVTAQGGTATETQSAATTMATPQEQEELAKKLIARDNFGAYIQAADTYRNLYGLSGQKDHAFLAARLEAVALSQLHQSLRAPIAADLQTIEADLKAAGTTSPQMDRAKAAAMLARHDFASAKTALDDVVAKNPQDAVAFALKGFAALLQTDLGQAEAAFQGAIQINPAQLLALHGLALTAKQKNDFSEIESRLQKVLELSPVHVASRIDLGIFYFKQGNIAEAEKNLAVITTSQSQDASGAELAEALYHLALVRRTQSKQDDAGKLLEQAATADPQNALVLATLAHYYLDAGRLEDAKNRFMSAIQIEKKADYQVGYACALVKEKKYGDALLYLQQAIRTEPQNSLALLQMGLVQKEMGNTDEAVSYIRQAQKIKPDGVEAYVELANIFSALQKNDLAINEYRQAVALAPKDASLHEALADLLQKKGQPGAAAAEFQKAVDLATDLPHRASLFQRIGAAHLDDGKFEEATQALNMANRLAPNDPKVLLTLGATHYKKGNFARAQEVLENLRETNPQGDLAVDLNFNLANVYIETANYAQALILFKKVLEKRPDFHMVHFRMGNLFMKQSIFEKALEEFQLVLPKLTDPNLRLSAQLDIARCYYENGVVQKAEAIYLETARAYPKNAEVFYRLGSLYDDQQLRQRSIENFKKAIALDPNDARSHEGLGYGYKATSDFRQAIHHFKMALKINPTSRSADQIKDEIEQLSRGR